MRARALPGCVGIGCANGHAAFAAQDSATRNEEHETMSGNLNFSTGLNSRDRAGCGVCALVCLAQAIAMREDAVCIRSEKRNSVRIVRLRNEPEHWKFESGNSWAGRTVYFERFRIAIGRRRRVSASKKPERTNPSARERAHERATAFTSCKTRTRRFPSFEINHKGA